MHILSYHKSAGSNFRILGCAFDCKLIMYDCVHETVLSANWKMRMLLRTHRFYSSRDIVNLYKAHLLSYIEYRTPALFHASHSTLVPLDIVQNHFLSNIGISIEDAAFHFKLLPLRQRRQIAALGIIQRAVLRKEPHQFWNWFIPDTVSWSTHYTRHTRILKEIVHHQSPAYFKRSLLGMIKIYNWLPQRIVDIANVKDFQHELQNLVLYHISSNSNWLDLFNPMCAFMSHPLART